jgi:hypothetical protein
MRTITVVVVFACLVIGLLVPGARTQEKPADKVRSEERGEKFSVVLETTKGHRLSEEKVSRKINTSMIEMGDSLSNIWDLQIRQIDLIVPLSWQVSDVKAITVTPADKKRRFAVVEIAEQGLGSNMYVLPDGKVLENRKTFSLVAVERRVDLPAAKGEKLPERRSK